MALDAQALAHTQQPIAPTAPEEDDFYNRILNIRDAVVAGTHPTLTLPPAALAALKASLLAPASPEDASLRAEPKETGNVFTNGLPASTNQAAIPPSAFPGLPGLGSNVPTAANTQTYNAKPISTGLDPIFLEKSNSLVRAEGQLKRQRIERDLFDNWEKRKHISGRDKEMLADAPANVSIDSALAKAHMRVKPVSGLKPAPRAASIATSFDENDYYSSQVQSEWSSDAGSGNGSDQAVGAFTADYESLDRRNGGVPTSSKARGKQPVQSNAALSHAGIPSKDRPTTYIPEFDGVNEADDEDEDEEYSPPEPTAFDSFYDADTTMDMQDVAANDDDDDSEYEPGEVTQDSVVVTPYQNNQSSAQPSPQVPIFRNHLSHIAAPQPNRVSPLAVQKGPSIELELVNGRPEIVNKPQQRNAQMQSRPSSASPPGPGSGPSSKKKKNNHNNKKRKREQEATKQTKKRQERQNAQSPPSPMYQEPYIKPEPVSPPPFSNVPEAQPYAPRYTNQAAPIQIDMDSPQHPTQPQYVYTSTPRYEYAPKMPPPTVVRVGSASGYRPSQRDNQDLRRVASMHYAQRPVSPAQRVYSPAAAYSSNGRVYAEPRQGSVAPYSPEVRYGEEAPAPRYPPVGSRQEPIRLQEYRESSPAMMPPPRRIVVDQYGNKYYAAEPASQPRASVAPVARHPEPEIGYERAPSRMPGAYQPSYEPAGSAMPPPPPPRRQAPQEQAVEYIDSNGYLVREYSTRPIDPVRYSHAPTSPVYQQQPQYEQMPPPSARPAPRDLHYEQMPPPPIAQPSHEPTSPVYAAPPPRAYSVRPDGQDVSQITYAPRQASVAPVQYARHEAAPPPARAMSVMPVPDYGPPAYQQQRAPSYAPQPAVRYVDEYGREVAPREVRQASQFRY